MKRTNNNKILVWVDGAEHEYYKMPRNFWGWTEKARRKYVIKRWPNATAIHNATPPGFSGRKLQWI